MLKCPICNEKLKKGEKNFFCEKSHSFDISKYGHANLLLSNQKNSKMPGDNKEMVISRKIFLEKNYYKGISEKLNLLICEDIRSRLSLQEKLEILDIGCGEGYYTNKLNEFLKNEFPNKNIELYGIDISKEAVISAAKSYKEKNITWLVASAGQLPFTEESLDYIICMFAKIVPEEKLRTLKKFGKFIVVSTGENHLQEIKEVVYEKVKKDFYLPAKDELLKEFSHIKTINYNYKVLINENESIINLFNMTPYRWRSPKEGVEKLFKLSNIEITVEVNIDVFEKK